MGSSLYAIGRVVKAFGIRGELIVEPLTSIPSRFSSMKRVLVGVTEAQVQMLTIREVCVENKGIRLCLADVNSRNDAEGLIGSFLFVREEDRVLPSPGSYYVDELIGLRVVDEAGSNIGTVREVMKLPAQDIYVVEQNGKRIMIPAVREFVLRVDIQQGVMVVKLIEGLTEV